jgi:fumarylacetoacetate (FAA) hydrolase
MDRLRPELAERGEPEDGEEGSVKLASLRGGRDGRLVVVSRDMSRARLVPEIAATLQQALDDWARLEASLAAVSRELNRGVDKRAIPFNPAEVGPPLPRAHQWADGSAYVNHVELVRRARGAPMPENFWVDPLIYQGGSDTFLGPREAIDAIDESHGIDFEGEVAVITDDVPMAVSADAALSHIKLVMLANDVSLRNLIPSELAKGFGFFQSKPSTAFSPVAATPDELGGDWREGKLHRPILLHLNGELFGRPDAGVDMTFDFGRLIAHAARTRRLGAGSIIGSGTVSNKEDGKAGRPLREGGVGYACIAEQRAVETIRAGRPATPFLKFGDRLRIEMLDGAGASIFGAIEQTLRRYTGPRNPSCADRVRSAGRACS